MEAKAIAYTYSFNINKWSKKIHISNSTFDNNVAFFFFTYSTLFSGLRIIEHIELFYNYQIIFFTEGKKHISPLCISYKVTYSCLREEVLNVQYQII